MGIQMPQTKIGVIGGSGVYQIEGLRDVEQVHAATPFGDPSDSLVVGTLSDRRIAFLPRHGQGHRLLPSEVPYLANIYALKALGVERIISISAVGSMREDYAPLDIVIPDQIFDRTKGRRSTFFGSGLVAHISFAEPFCPELNGVLFDAAQRSGAHAHIGGTLVVIEGPAFSTKAESRIYRQWNVDVIGMTGLPEAKLAREAEMCYSAIAMVTDYDVWHQAHGAVTVELVVQNLLKNAEMGKKILSEAILNIPSERTRCPCHDALKHALITNPAVIPAKTREGLDLLVGKYLAK
jgi:5'-methylthioadenosine phosphorylase